MSNTGIVSEVFGANVPDTNRPAQKVIVDRAGQPQVAFFIPIGVAPAEGEAIEWGPHHAWWVGERVDKLTWAMAP